FMAEYAAVRRAEGRGDDDPSFYRALPFHDLTGRFVDDWRIRAVSYQALVNRVLPPLATRWRRPLRILDLGAGNCWLSYRLASSAAAGSAADVGAAGVPWWPWASAPRCAAASGLVSTTTRSFRRSRPRASARPSPAARAASASSTRRSTTPRSRRRRCGRCCA